MLVVIFFIINKMEYLIIILYLSDKVVICVSHTIDSLVYFNTKNSTYGALNY